MISVIIPLYNKEKQIAKTLWSVLAQTYTDYEIVIIDDGSTDGSVAELHKVQDPRIRLIQQKNAGVSAARNRGIEEARFDLIAFLDADDRWKPTYLQTQYELFLKYPQCSVFACNYEFVDPDEVVRSTIIRKLPYDGQDGVLSNYFEVASCSHPPICSISIMVRKTAMQQIGGFPLGVRLGEDLLTWARLACRYEIAYSQKVSAAYLIGTDRHIVTTMKPDEYDYVGKELAMLSKIIHDPYFTHYIRLWHKMRFVMFILADMRQNAFLEYRKMHLYGKSCVKDYVWLIINCMPHFFKRILLNLASLGR